MIQSDLYGNIQLYIIIQNKLAKFIEHIAITIAKIEEICKLIPALANEIKWDRGETKKSKHDVKYVFKNGSYIDVLAAAESSRGQRRNAGIIEEAILVEQKTLTEIIIPTTSVNRKLPDGTTDPEEILNRSQTWITSAGYKNSYPFKRLIELLVQSIIDPDEVMILGGTYKIPVYEGLLDMEFINQLKMEDTYKEDSFEREFQILRDSLNIVNCGDLFLRKSAAKPYWKGSTTILCGVHCKLLTMEKLY